MREGLIIAAAVVASIGGFVCASLWFANKLGRWLAWCDENRQ